MGLKEEGLLTDSACVVLLLAVAESDACGMSARLRFGN